VPGVILVTGSTGRIGREVAFGLVLKDIQLRAMIHNGAGNEWLNWSNVETVMGDFAKPDTLDAALSGIDKAFLLSSASPQQVELQNAFIDACVRNGVKHVVKVSAMGADAASSCRLMRWHAETEAYLKASGMRATILRPNLFFDGIVTSKQTIESENVIYGALDPQVRVSMIDSRDVAAVAAAKLLEIDGPSETVDVTGAHALTQNDVAAAVSRLVERTVSYTQLSADDYVSALREAAVPAETAQGIAEMHAWYNTGSGERVVDTVERIAGKAPTTLDDYLFRISRKLGHG
jgi:uncharacterized protein YbjT (DUF2867 family)